MQTLHSVFRSSSFQLNSLVKKPWEEKEEIRDYEKVRAFFEKPWSLKGEEETLVSFNIETFLKALGLSHVELRGSYALFCAAEGEVSIPFGDIDLYFSTKNHRNLLEKALLFFKDLGCCTAHTSTRKGSSLTVTLYSEEFKEGKEVDFSFVEEVLTERKTIADTIGFEITYNPFKITSFVLKGTEKKVDKKGEKEIIEHLLLKQRTYTKGWENEGVFPRMVELFNKGFSVVTCFKQILQTMWDYDRDLQTPYTIWSKVQEHAKKKEGKSPVFLLIYTLNALTLFLKDRKETLTKSYKEKK